MAYMPEKIFEQPIEYSKCSIFPDMPYFLNDLGLFKKACEEFTINNPWNNEALYLSNTVNNLFEE